MTNELADLTMNRPKSLYLAIFLRYRNQLMLHKSVANPFIGTIPFRNS